MSMRISSIALLMCFSIISLSDLCSQSDFTYTKDFEQKLQKFSLQYFQPTEMWLHPVPHQDEYDEYDLVLYSEDQKVEVRYLFRDENSPLALATMPHLEFYRSIIDFASNDHDANEIIIQDMDLETANEKYNADWCLTALFTPKQSISSKPLGTILGIYKEDTGLIFCMVFNTEELPEYFDLPIKFKL